MEMSKAQTLINIASYLSKHSEATDEEISSSLNISKTYLTECKKDINALLPHVCQILLRKNEVNLLKSKLSMNVRFEREIIDKLQKVYPNDKLGSVRICLPEDKITNEYLNIALWSPQNDRSHIDFWLKRLLYDIFFIVNVDGSIDYRLASTCESMDGYSRWRLKLKDDLYWSDGKSVTNDDILYTMNIILDKYNTPIQDIKKVSHNEIIFSLFKDDALFFLKIDRIPIFPAHSPFNYEVTNGPFLLKKNKSKNQYNLYRNKNYYREGYPKIDQVKLKIFNRPSFAVKAVVDGDMDFFFPRSLIETRQYTPAMVPNFLFNDSNYWAILINKNSRNLDSESKINRLKESLDHDIISQSFFREILRAIKIRSTKKKLSLNIGYIADMPSIALKYLIRSISYCLGLEPDTAVDVNGCSFESIGKTIDIILGQFYFGQWYSRLRFYFHSKGECNIFGINDPEIDSLLDRLDLTIPIDERNRLGKQILDVLNDKNMIILLTPCFEYILSNLHIEQSSKLSSVTDFIMNLSDIVVERKRITV
jgi:ABC-type transport system substrate-binding protein